MGYALILLGGIVFCVGLMLVIMSRVPAKFILAGIGWFLLVLGVSALALCVRFLSYELPYGYIDVPVEGAALGFLLFVGLGSTFLFHAYRKQLVQSPTSVKTEQGQGLTGISKKPLTWVLVAGGIILFGVFLTLTTTSAIGYILLVFGLLLGLVSLIWLVSNKLDTLDTTATGQQPQEELPNPVAPVRLAGTSKKRGTSTPTSTQVEPVNSSFLLRDSRIINYPGSLVRTP